MIGQLLFRSLNEDQGAVSAGDASCVCVWIQRPMRLPSTLTEPLPVGQGNRRCPLGCWPSGRQPFESTISNMWNRNIFIKQFMTSTLVDTTNLNKNEDVLKIYKYMITVC